MGGTALTQGIFRRPAGDQLHNKSLRSTISQSPKLVSTVLKKLDESLQIVHSRSMAHRDIRPANVMVSLSSEENNGRMHREVESVVLLGFDFLVDAEASTASRVPPSTHLSKSLGAHYLPQTFLKEWNAKGLKLVDNIWKNRAVGKAPRESWLLTDAIVPENLQTADLFALGAIALDLLALDLHPGFTGKPWHEECAGKRTSAKFGTCMMGWVSKHTSKYPKKLAFFENIVLPLLKESKPWTKKGKRGMRKLMPQQIREHLYNRQKGLGSFMSLDTWEDQSGQEPKEGAKAP